MAIVWAPLPGLTQLLPPIGHAGIQTFASQDVHDFDGPYHISVSPLSRSPGAGFGTTGFGPVFKRIEVSSRDIRKVPPGMSPEQAWDSAIDRASSSYRGKTHNLFLQNCHHHVAVALNDVEYLGFTHWNTTTLTLWFLLRGEFVSRSARIRTYGMFVVILSAWLLFWLFGPETASAVPRGRRLRR
jgi:transmembrane protein 222